MFGRKSVQIIAFFIEEHFDVPSTASYTDIKRKHDNVNSTQSHICFIILPIASDMLMQ